MVATSYILGGPWVLAEAGAAGAKAATGLRQLLPYYPSGSPTVGGVGTLVAANYETSRNYNEKFNIYHETANGKLFVFLRSENLKNRFSKKMDQV